MGMLDGKVAIVTGSGRGIGREEALLLASEGAKVIVNDVGASLQGDGDDKHPAEEVVELIKAGGSDGAVNSSDVSSWQGAKDLIDQAVDTFGQLDILVNNAGILRDKMSFNIEESDWDDVIRVHLKGHFAPSHHAAVYWRARVKAGETVSGRIINTSSEAGLFGNAGQANYSSAKAGIASLTVVLARELERYGITVNAISPRARTRMTENLFGGHDQGLRGLRRVGPTQHRPAGGVPGLRRGCRCDRPELRGLRWKCLGHGWVPPRGRSSTATRCGPPRSWPRRKGTCSRRRPPACRSSASSRTPAHRRGTTPGLPPTLRQRLGAVGGVGAP